MTSWWDERLGLLETSHIEDERLTHVLTQEVVVRNWREEGGTCEKILDQGRVCLNATNESIGSKVCDKTIKEPSQ